MIVSLLLGLLVAIVVGLVWAATIGSYAGVAALVAFIAVVILAVGDGRSRVP